MEFYIDIETRKSDVCPNFDIKAPSNYKDAKKIAEYKQKKMMEEWGKTSLDEVHGNICCIGWAFGDEKAQAVAGENEEALVRHIWEEIKGRIRDKSGALVKSKLTWITHNGLEFDLPWLYIRSIKYGLDMHKYMPDKRDVYDVMKEFNPYKWKAYYKQSLMTEYLGGIPGDSNGSMVQGWYDSGDLGIIASYCEGDIEELRHNYKKINGKN